MKKQGFNRIALIGREGTEGVPETLTALVSYLLKLKKQVVLEESTAHIIKNKALPVVAAKNLKSHADLLIVVGGDGSMLNAAHIAVVQQLPVLGINRGRLGFLTDVHPDHLDKIDAILQGDYQEEQRFLLDAQMQNEGQVVAKENALNDVVLLPGDVAQMIEFDIYVNEEFVCSQRADGLIIATPTGSTAYALSGGGPILHPDLEAMVIVPMFPHTLSSRPIVVSARSKIRLAIAKENSVSPYVSCDGQTRVAINPGGQIHIQRKQEELHLIHPQDYNYFDTLRRKLDWEKRATRV